MALSPIDIPWLASHIPQVVLDIPWSASHIPQVVLALTDCKGHIGTSRYACEGHIRGRFEDFLMPAFLLIQILLKSFWGVAFRRRNWTHGIGLTELHFWNLKNWTYGTSLREHCQGLKICSSAHSLSEELCKSPWDFAFAALVHGEWSASAEFPYCTGSKH